MKGFLFPLYKNFDSTSRNERFIKKIRFHYAEKLLSPPGISKETVENGFKK